jgi:hypothetical protein
MKSIYQHYLIPFLTGIALLIVNWGIPSSSGVSGATSVSAITVPSYDKMKSETCWAPHADKIDIFSAYILQAGIPCSAYATKIIKSRS